MIEKIIDGICNSLNSEFGNSYEIYTESIEQGLSEPCFSILCLSPTDNWFKNNKYYRSNLFCIQYFPSGNEPRMECQQIWERLYDCLFEIQLVEGNVTGITRGSKMHAEIIDGVLSFFVNYNMFVYKVEDAIENMEDLSIETDVEE